MPIDPRIALSIKSPEIPSSLDAYARFAQIQGMQQEQQMNALRLAAAQREEEQRNALLALDPSSPEYGQQLYRISPTIGAQYAKEQAATRASQAKQTQSETSAAQTRQQMLAQAHRDISINPSDEQIAEHTKNIQNSNLFTPEEKARSVATQQTLLSMPFEQRKTWLSQQGASVGELTPKPAAKTELARLFEEQRNFPPGSPQFNAYQRAIDKQTTHAPGVSVNVGTEKKYGEAFAGKIADTDIKKLEIAQTAPRLAESANRIIDLAQNPNIFVGPAADVKLNIARALNVVGVNNDETIANTEKLISATSESTLNAIKSSGLGSGQGFTDNDLKFLQGVAGGQINLTKDTLQRLAELQHKTATASAEAWNKRVKQIPSDVLSGTGMTTEPIQVPELKSAKQKTVFSSADKQALDWANANPNDPRSAQIKQRLGVK